METESQDPEIKIFRGGIQKGTVAWDEESRKLDNQLARVAKKLKTHPAILTLGITSQYKLKKEQIPGNIGSCSPDGNIWFDKEGKILAAFEAKKQGSGGNAIERWFKNEYILRSINSNINYVTFACGKGATIETPIGQTLAIAVYENGEHHFNEYRKNKNSIFMSVEGFSDEDIETIMLEAIIGN